MKIAVIGTGPAGLATIKALVRQGIRPVVIDVGERLPVDRQAVVTRMALLAPEQWSSEDRNCVMENPTISQPGIPKKHVFGSDYHFGRDRPFSPLEADDSLPVPTYARGGYTVAWGAAMMPAHDCDLDKWPIRRSDLETSYRRILADIPLSAAPDALSEEFPLLKEDVNSLVLSKDIHSFLVDLLPINRVGGNAPFLSGQARLAIDASACRRCGLCLSGCVYGAIYSTEPDIDHLQATGRIELLEGWAVQSLREDRNGVILSIRHAVAGDNRQERFDRVFMAAGAIESTRIVLNSLQMFDKSVIMKDSQKLVLPLLRLKRWPLSWPNTVALSGAFLDFKVPAISNHWVHAQISSINDYVLRRLKISAEQKSVKSQILAPLYERLLIAWCGLHSDHSSAIVLTLSSRNQNHLPVLELRAEINEETQLAARRVTRYLMKALLPSHTLVIAPLLKVGAPGGGNHLGGAMPMHAKPKGRLDTDLLGRLSDWRSVHVVDGSILPSIPATTIALLQMANADRIAMSALASK